MTISASRAFGSRAEFRRACTRDYGIQNGGMMAEYHGHPRFYELVDRVRALHDAKNHDYAGESDPLRNFRRSTLLGVEPWRGILVRMSDKFSRLETLSTTPAAVASESMTDTLLDLACYALLAIVLREEAGQT